MISQRPLTPEERRERRFSRFKWQKARRTELYYGRQLRKIARTIQDFIEGHLVGADPAQIHSLLDRLASTLHSYSRIIRPWSESVAARMLADVANRDLKAWQEQSEQISMGLREEVQSADIGAAYQEGMARQVDLITSLPREAAERINKIATEQYITGRRYTSLIDEILETGSVTRSRATLIARTEVSRAATEMTRARAQFVGSPGYTWRATRDSRTRHRHRQLNGTYHTWDDPPIASEPGQKEMRYHPGQGPNCRCWPEPVLVDTIE